MKTYDEYERTARDGRPFSNSTEWEVFQFDVCMGQGHTKRRCVNDDSADDGDGCPLILLFLDERWPAEWVGARYGPTRCTEKTTAAEQRRADRQQRAEAQTAAQYPMFPESSG